MHIDPPFFIQMKRPHFVVTKGPDGKAVLHPMKAWVRGDPSNRPGGLSPDENTSHELRRAFRRDGWVVQELPDRVLVIKPDEQGDTSFAEGEVEASITEAEEEDLAETEEVTFGLERDLQAALRANIDQLEEGLKIIDGGIERSTQDGRIDITASDQAGRIVIVELKAGQAKPLIIAQVLAYMASIAGSEKKPVRGILVAGSFHPRVVLAARAIPNLDLKRYGFQFSFRPIE